MSAEKVEMSEFSTEEIDLLLRKLNRESKQKPFSWKKIDSKSRRQLRQIAEEIQVYASESGMPYQTILDSANIELHIVEDSFSDTINPINILSC